MNILEQNFTSATAAFILMFVACPAIMLCGAAVVCVGMYIIKRLADALRLHRMALPRCSQCCHYGTTQCPLCGQADPDDFCSRGERRDT